MQPGPSNSPNTDDSKYDPEVSEKTSLGGDFNTGVTSDDPAEKDEIEKKALWRMSGLEQT